MTYSVDRFLNYSYCYITKLALSIDDTGGVERDLFCI